MAVPTKTVDKHCRYAGTYGGYLPDRLGNQPPLMAAPINRSMPILRLPRQPAYKVG